MVEERLCSVCARWVGDKDNTVVIAQARGLFSG
jgi:hypothetical protein